ncbi:MAG TPA: DUF4386 domain-containing protein [Acidobacteriota bacterium]|nr:DUF4386 domain-containing protein [Acidobacteriota bacterium]
MLTLSKKARVAGLLYVLASAVGIVRLLYVPKVLIVHGNATATAGNILAHEMLFRLGIVCYLLGGVLWLFVPLALYRLLKDVDQALAVMMVILGSLMQTPVFVINTMNDAAALLLFRGADFLSVIDKTQRDALGMLFLNLHHQLDMANEIFWGIWLIPFGLLVYKSRFLPRFLGIWLTLGCFGWVALSLTGFLIPDYVDQVYRFVQLLTLGEVVTMLWLVILGAREKPLVASGAS